VALGEGGWQAIDLADPARPVRVATERTSRYTLRVAAAGRRVYLGNLDTGLEAVEASDPARPAYLGGESLGFPGLSAVAVGDDLLCAGRADWLLVYRLSEAGVPTPAGSWRCPGVIDDVLVRGDLAYLAAENAGLVIVSLEDPARPLPLGTWASGRIARRLAISGTQLCLSAGYRDGSLNDAMEVIDVGDPRQPRALGTHPLAPSAGAVAVSGTTAFVTQGGWLDAQDRWHPGFMDIVDIAVPTAPRRLGSLHVGGSVGGLVIVGNRLYICSRPSRFLQNDPEAGLHVLDISRPATPVRMGRYPLPDDNFSDLALAGDLLAVANASHGVLLLDPNPLASVALDVARDAGGLRFRWPAGVTGAELQRTDRLPDGLWRTVSGSPRTNSVWLPAGPGGEFFRLGTP